MMMVGIEASQLLLPFMVLVLWTLVVHVIAMRARMRHMKEAKITPEQANSPTTMPSFPIEVQAKMDNYNHLFEQPVLFYALCLCLVVQEKLVVYVLICAWLYVFLRIVHSIIQCTSNNVIQRFMVFAISWIPLIGLMVAAFSSIFAAM